MTCTHCNGTGSLSKDLDGFLDCAHCDVAQERTALEAWADEHAPDCYSQDLWLIYQHGKAAKHAQLLPVLKSAQQFIQGSGHHTPEIDAALAAAPNQ